MKIGWLQNVDFLSIPGGAEFTDRAHFRFIEKQGIEQTIYTPQSVQFLSHVDLLIISNIIQFQPSTIKKLCERYPYVFFIHDYYPLCKHQLSYPKILKCKKCGSKKFWLSIIQNAKRIIWLSPLHRKAWLYACPELWDTPYAVIPSPIDVSLFYDMKLEREKNSVICLNPYSFKGADNLVKFAEEHNEYKYYWVGNTDTEDKLRQFTKLGYIPYFELNRILNRCEYWIELPFTPQPCERQALEAVLAGCKLIVNRMVGATSYKWFRDKERLRKEVSGAPRRFWEAIEKVL